MELALAVLVKDESKLLDKLLGRYKKYFDEVCVLSTAKDKEVEKVIERHNVNRFGYEWKNDFADARNYLASKIKSPYYFRLDVDDEIDHPELVKDIFEEYVEKDFSLIYFKYYYGFDEDGHCNALHWRETIIKNDGNLRWNKAIHENLLPKALYKFKAGKDTRVSLIHKATYKRHKDSTERNLAALLREYEKTKGNPDPRTVGYIARMYLGLKKPERAVPFFEKFLQTSGWDDDKYFAWVQLCDCYTTMELYERAVSCCFEALTIHTNFPDVYFRLMGVYFEKGDFKKAIEWGKMGFEKPTPDTMLVIDPSSYTWRPLAVMGMCYMNLGKFKEALTAIEKAKELAPKVKSIKNTYNFLLEVYQDNEATKKYLALILYTKDKDIKKLPSLIQAIPKQIAKDERIIKMRHRVEPPRVWPRNSIAIFCGQIMEDWADPSVIEGIGGSESAVIYLSRELTSLGYEVTVFNNCGDMEGEYRRVNYKQFYEFNPTDKYNIVISWRQNIFGNLDARRKVVWLHDVPRIDQFENETETFDKIIVLSQFHKDCLSSKIPENKIYVSRNGLNLPDYQNIIEKRNPRRVIYSSSYDRGLVNLLRMWADVLKEVPGAELHIFYGWKLYDMMAASNKEFAELKREMLGLMGLPNVFEHGRIGKTKLAREFHKSGIWAYPTAWPEISCITAMQAQVCGAIPISSDVSALNETIKKGVKIKGKSGDDGFDARFKDELIHLLQHPEVQEKMRAEIVAECKGFFDWRGVAKEWQRDLFGGLDA